MPARKGPRKTRKKRRSVGFVEREYYQLFLARLRREGRYKDYRAKLSEAYKQDGNLLGGRWNKIAREFGFVSKADEVVRFERWMLTGAKTRMEIERDELQEQIKQEQRMQEVQALPDPEAMELPVDVAWVYSHPAMLRPASKSGVVVLDPATDFHGAPSKGAVGMLQFFVNNKRDFYRMVLSHLTKKDIAAGDDKELEDDLRDVKEIEHMLQQL